MHSIYFLPAIVKLGVKSLECHRNGICEIQIIKEFAPLEKPLKGQAYAFIYIVFGQLLATYFYANSIERSTIEKNFAGTVFAVEEDYDFEINAGSYTTSYTIAAGSYPIHVLNDFFIVDFQETSQRLYSQEALHKGANQLAPLCPTY